MQLISRKSIQVYSPPKQVIQKLEEISEIIDPYEDEEILYQSQFTFYIAPTHLSSLIWNGVVMFFIYVYLIELGFILGFGSSFWITQSYSPWLLGLHLIVFLLFLVDIIISFFKGYYKVGTGKIIKNQRQIIKEYIKKSFLFDLISITVVILPFLEQTPAVDMLQLLFFLKLRKKLYYQNQIHRQVQHISFIRNTFSIAILAADTAIIAHFVACFFIEMDISMNNNQLFGDNPLHYWLSNNADYANSLIGGPWYYQYIYGQQYSTGTLSTLAPGPFPKNPVEVLYVIFVMSSFIIFTSYIADGIITLFYSQQQRRVFHETNIQVFQNYMKIKNVSKPIKSRVRNFFQLVWQVEGKTDLEFQKKVIQRLSSKLRQQLMIELVNTNSISFIHYLNQRKQIIKKLVNYIELVMTDAYEIIFAPSKIKSQKYLYIPIEGMVKYYVIYGNKKEEKQNILSLSNLERILGTYEFVTNQNYYYYAKAIHISQFYRISQSNFLQIIISLQLQEKYKQIQHRVLLDKVLNIINKNCLVCMKEHLEQSCPTINYSLKVRSNYFYEQHSKRKVYARREKKLKRSLLNMNNIRPKVNSKFDPNYTFEKIFQITYKEIVYQEFETWHNFSSYKITQNLSDIQI